MTVLLECIYKWQQNTFHVLLDHDYSIRIYQSFAANFSKILPIMLALCLILLLTYYVQNYTGIIGWSLLDREVKEWFGAVWLCNNYYSLEGWW